MILCLEPNGQGPRLLTQLHDALLPHRKGHCDVAVQYMGTDASARLQLGPEWTVRPSRELRDKLTGLLGQGSVRLLYPPGREML
jgi:DNA polymerase-3 subunit alpha